MKQFVDSFIIESGENVLPKHLLVPDLKNGRSSSSSLFLCPCKLNLLSLRLFIYHIGIVGTCDASFSVTFYRLNNKPFSQQTSDLSLR